MKKVVWSTIIVIVCAILILGYALYVVFKLMKDVDAIEAELDATQNDVINLMNEKNAEMAQRPESQVNQTGKESGAGESNSGA